MAQKIIRLRLKNKKSNIIEIVVTEVGTRSKYKIWDKIGFFYKGDRIMNFALNSMKLGTWLNKGAIIKKSVKRYLIFLTQANLKN